MLIDMWRTTKRENSTATPVSQPGMFSQHIQKEVKLKEETSVLTPSFILSMSGHDGQNYIWAFGRYYWVTNITSLANNLWEISCKIDPLGSYRGHIRNTEAFVLYDSTANTEIPDRRLGVKTTATYSQSTALMPWGFEQSNGTYFIAVTGDKDVEDVHGNKLADDATGVYSLTMAGIEDLGFEFSDDWEDIVDKARDDSGLTDTLNDIKTITQQTQTAAAAASTWDKFGIWFSWLGDLVFGYGADFITQFLAYWFLFVIYWGKALFTGGKALENIKAAYWLPFHITDGSAVSKIALGGWVEPITGGAKKISTAIKAENVTISIPWQYSDWRNVSNTEIQLFIPLIGVINIPSSAVKGHSTITVMCSLNLFSGTFAVKIRCGQAVLGTYGTSCASPVLIGNSNINMGSITNTVTATVATVASVASGNVVGAVGGATAMVASGFESLSPIATSVGGIGGGTGNALGSSIWCTTICHNTSDNPSDLLPIIGTPTNVLKQLNGTGFCQCLQAHMSMNAVTGESYPTEEEVRQVNSALNSGVFLE